MPQEDDPDACVTEAGCLEPLFEVLQQRIDQLLNRFSIPALERARKERENAVEDDGATAGWEQAAQKPLTDCLKVRMCVIRQLTLGTRVYIQQACYPGNVALVLYVFGLRWCWVA